MLRLLHKPQSLGYRIFTKLYQTWINTEKRVLNGFLIPAAPWDCKCGGGGDHVGIPPLKTSNPIYFSPTAGELVYTGSCFSADNTAGAVPLQYILTSIHCYLWQRHGRLIPETNSFFRPFWREIVVESRPPTSLQRSEINESEAWTLTWLLRHEQEATLPPSVAIMLSSHWLLMHSGLLAEMVSYGRDERMRVFVLKKNKKHLKTSQDYWWKAAWDSWQLNGA